MILLAPMELAAAAADPKHPKHHFAWGQLLGVALFGLAGFEGGPAVYANPAYLGQFIAGVSSLFQVNGITGGPSPVLKAPAAPAPGAAPLGSQLGNQQLGSQAL
jgi:hypothetical protein